MSGIATNALARANATLNSSKTYISGTFANVNGTDNGNGTARFEWKDDVWGEANHLIVVIYSKTMNIKGEWEPSVKKIIEDGVGQHRNIGGQSESESFDFTASLKSHEITGKELPIWTFYRACLFAYFQPIIDYGDMKYSKFNRSKQLRAQRKINANSHAHTELRP